jgi:IS5 family transposase
MKSFDDFFMKKEYARVELLGDKLAEIEPLINWEVFRPIIRDMYDNHTKLGGRPNNDENVSFTIVVWFIRS